MFTTGASSPRGGAAREAAEVASAGAPRCPLPLPLLREATEGAAAATETRKLRRRRRLPGFLLQPGRCRGENAGGAGPAPGASAPGAATCAPAGGARPPSLPESPGLSPRGTGRQRPAASSAALRSNRPGTADKLVFSTQGTPLR